MTRLDQENDPEILRKAVALLQSHNHVLTKKLAEALRELAAAQDELAKLKGEPLAGQLRLEALEQQIAKLTKQLFGTSSEKLGTGEEPKTLCGEGGEPKTPGSEGEEPKKDKDKKPQRGHGPTAQPKLPRIDIEHDLDEPDKMCPACGGALKEMKDQYEEHDEIDVVPLRFVIKHHRRKKYRCACGGCIETAPGPDKLCPGARYSVDFAIHVATTKYDEHAPLERQVRSMWQDGLDVTSQTLWDQIERLERVVSSVRPRLLAYLLSHAVVGADETRWELFGKKAGEGKSWYVWLLSVDDGVYYMIRGSRSAETAAELLSTYAGVLMCDGYDAYLALAKQYPRVLLAHCWAHVRRKFFDLLGSFPKACSEILDLIRELYLIEKQCARGPAGDECRRDLRDRESREVIDKIVAWFYRTLPTCLPESGLYKAIGYMVHMWPGLVLFLDDPRIPLDNNGTERAARGPVVGRKNHYGSRSLRGTEIAATFYSLVESAKLNGLSPRFYLRVAARAGLRGEQVPLPHEVKAMVAKGTLDPAVYEDDTEPIVAAALAAARAQRGERPPTDDTPIRDGATASPST
jgi:transposase